MSAVWGRENRGKPSPRKICGASNPQPGDSVRQLSPLHQACPCSGFIVLIHNVQNRIIRQLNLFRCITKGTKHATKSPANGMVVRACQRRQVREQITLLVNFIINTLHISIDWRKRLPIQMAKKRGGGGTSKRGKVTDTFSWIGN